MYLLWRLKFGNSISKPEFMAKLHTALLKHGHKYYHEKFVKPFVDFHSPRKEGGGPERKGEKAGENGMKGETELHEPIHMEVKKDCIVCKVIFKKRKQVQKACNRYVNRNVLIVLFS